MIGELCAHMGLCCQDYLTQAVRAFCAVIQMHHAVASGCGPQVLVQEMMGYAALQKTAPGCD